MLAPMSYVTDFGETVVKKGGIPLLVEAVDLCSHDIELGNNSPILINALTGACKMLGNIALNPSFQIRIVEAGAVESVSQAVRILQKQPEAAAACCSLIAPLVKMQESAEQFLSVGGMDSLVAALEANPTHSSLLLGVSTVISEISRNPSCCEYTADLGVFGVCEKVASPKVEGRFLGNYYEALSEIAPHLTSLDLIKEVDPGMQVSRAA